MSPEKIKFSKEDREFFAAARTADPAVDQLFKSLQSLMTQFSGSHITHLLVNGREWGVKSEGGVIPSIRTSIPDSKKAPKPTTQNAKRVARTKYKE